MSENPIYLDYNATTPIDPKVVDAMMPWISENFGNPSSGHIYGVKAKLAIEKARKEVAFLLSASSDEIFFTANGTESNNLAITGALNASKKREKHIIISAVEHPAVEEVCKWHEKNGVTVTRVGVDSFGIPNPEDVEKNICPETVLISIMHANNETGSIFPIREISDIAHKHNVLVHTDASQSAGKISTSVEELGVDLLTIAGHKLYAPKGVGALYVKNGVQISSILFGANHERGLRPGTENVPYIVALGEACRLAKENRSDNYNKMLKLRNLLHSLLLKSIPNLRLNGHPEKRLPNTLNVSFKNIISSEILNQVEGIAASAGSACHTGEISYSNVLLEMSVPSEYIGGAFRFSVGKYTTEVEIKKAVDILVTQIRK